MDWNIVNFIRGMFEKPQRKTSILLVYIFVALCAWKSLPILPNVADLPERCLSTFAIGAWKMGAAALLFGLIPMGIVKFVFRERLSDYGVTFGIKRRTIFNILTLVPLFAVMGWFSRMDTGFLNVYPLNPCASWQGEWFWLHAATYLFLYYFSYEFFFRGFIQHGLSESCGVLNAVLIQAAMAAFFHFGHPCCELWSSFLGSLLWGFLVLRTRSLVSGWLQHAALGVFLDAGLVGIFSL